RIDHSVDVLDVFTVGGELEHHHAVDVVVFAEDGAGIPIDLDLGDGEAGEVALGDQRGEESSDLVSATDDLQRRAYDPAAVGPQGHIGRECREQCVQVAAERRSEEPSGCLLPYGRVGVEAG